MGRIGAVFVRIVLSVHFLEKPRRPEVANQVFRFPFGRRTAFGPEPDSFKQQNADDHGQYGRHHQHSKNCGIYGHGIFTPMKKTMGSSSRLCLSQPRGATVDRHDPGRAKTVPGKPFPKIISFNKLLSC
jgi:hypothetical protein